LIHFLDLERPGAVAKKLGRDFIGIEREEEYRKVAKNVSKQSKNMMLIA
jgi:DNA modification methylase